MATNTKPKENEITDKEKAIAEKWRDFINSKFDKNRLMKAMLNYAFYHGDSDELAIACLKYSRIDIPTNILENLNTKNYFWVVASSEVGVKKVHSGITKAIIKTLVSVLGKPENSITKEVINDFGEVDEEADLNAEKELESIIKKNKLMKIVKEQQQPLNWVMGEGAFVINVDTSKYDYPRVEYVDARNVAFEREGNDVTKVYIRQYFNHEQDSHMLLQERGVMDVDVTDNDNNKVVKKASYVKYHLFKLTNVDSREIAQEVPLDTIDETKHLKDCAFVGLESILAIPCVYDFDVIQQHGTGIFEDRLDLIDALDETCSQANTAVRVSTPIDYMSEDFLEHDADGNPIKPNKYDRKIVTTKSGINSVGENGSGINPSNPSTDFSGYTAEQLSLVERIITGIISPSTLGINVSKVDNGETQREKEKITMFTRDALIESQTDILQQLYELLLQVNDFINNREVGKYNIAINYPEYGNPTFESKLQNLYPAFASGAMSPKRYVKELWGDSLTEDEAEEEIAYLEAQKQLPTDLELPPEI